MFPFDALTSHARSPLLHSKIDEYSKWLFKANDGKPHRTVPTLKAVWRAGDLKPKLEAWNRDISRIHRHWQVGNGLLPKDDRSPPKQDQVNLRTFALLQGTRSQVLDRLDNLARVQTNTTSAIDETIRAEATEVIKVIQHTAVQTRTRSLSVHSQIEPDGFASQTTRVRRRLLASHIIDRHC